MSKKEKKVKAVEPTTIRKSIVKESKRIREVLMQRFDELKLIPRVIVADARKRGMGFTEASLSRYLKHGNEIKGTLSEENIIWLTIRYGIEVKLYVGKPSFDGKSINFKVMPYNEEKCLADLKKYWKA